MTYEEENVDEERASLMDEKHGMVHNPKIDNNPDKLLNMSKIKKSVKRNPWIIVSVLLGIAVIVLLYMVMNNGSSGTVVSQEVAGNKVVEFLNQRTGGGVEYASAQEIGNLYEVMVSYQGQEIPVFVTRDGVYFVQGAVSMDEQIPSSDLTQQPAPVDIPKSDKPAVELYVMSFCPYGNRAEETMLPVYNLLKDKVDWKVNYIVSVSGDSIKSLHGQPETDQNIREVCVKKEYGLDKFWKFISYVNNNCGSDGSCWETGASGLGIDTNKIKTCFDSEGIDLMKTEAQISGDAGANGSPTLLINGVKSNSVYQYGNSETYKQAICSAFNTAPEECNEVLEGNSAGTNTGGSC